jgi:hypothetical protein
MNRIDSGSGKAPWDEIRERHCLFWKCDKHAGILEGTKRTSAFTLGDMEFDKKEGELQPNDVIDENVWSWADRLFEKGDGFLDGDLVWGAPPFPGIPWMEAIFNARVIKDSESSSLWPEHWIASWEEFFTRRPDKRQSDWYAKLKSLIEGMSSHINGRYPMTQALMQGPSDIMAALRGINNFCMDFNDDPYALASAIEFIAQEWISIARELFEITPSWDGGYPAPRLEVWAPGRLIRIEEDATILISPEMYRDYFLDSDRKIFGAFEYSLIHTHSANRKIVPMLVQIPELKGIQILQDTMGPSVVEMIDVFRLVQDSGKALLITHELSDEDVRYLKNTLSPAGLAIERMNQ